MKKYVLGIVLGLFCLSGLMSVCFAEEIIIDAKGAVKLDDKDVPPVNPPAYKHVEQKEFDVKLNNPEYIKDIPAPKNKHPLFDLQLKRPSIRPYQQ